MLLGSLYSTATMIAEVLWQGFSLQMFFIAQEHTGVRASQLPEPLRVLDDLCTMVESMKRRATANHTTFQVICTDIASALVSRFDQLVAFVVLAFRVEIEDSLAAGFLCQPEHATVAMLLMRKLLRVVEAGHESLVRCVHIQKL